MGIGGRGSGRGCRNRRGGESKRGTLDCFSGRVFAQRRQVVVVVVVFGGWDDDDVVIWEVAAVGGDDDWVDFVGVDAGFVPGFLCFVGWLGRGRREGFVDEDEVFFEEKDLFLEAADFAVETGEDGSAGEKGMGGADVTFHVDESGIDGEGFAAGVDEGEVPVHGDAEVVALDLPAGGGDVADDVVGKLVERAVDFGEAVEELDRKSVV